MKSARAYVTSHGLYELEINGQRVGDQLFTPGWTSYHNRLQYQTYDVTSHLRAGRERDRRDARRRLVPRLPRLEGPAQRLRRPPRPAAARSGSSTPTAASRPWAPTTTWKSATGPILHVGHLQRRDLRRAAGAARAGARPATTTRDWAPVRVREAARSATLVAPGGPAGPADRGDPAGQDPEDARRRDGLRHGPEHGRLGAAEGAGARRARRSRCATPRCSTRHGNFYTANLRAAKQHVHATRSRAAAPETYEPHFTFQGFRYVAVDG